MFTGIIKQQSAVTDRSDENETATLSFKTPSSWQLVEGESVNINGVCSTVTKSTKKAFQVAYMPETRRISTVDEWSVGTPVNLERSLRADELLGGHVVQGHVDGTAELTSREEQGDSELFTFKAPKKLTRYIVPKGAITIDGVSLTVVETNTANFSIALVPYTLAHTTLGSLNAGDHVNIETDIFARYLDSLLEARGHPRLTS